MLSTVAGDDDDSIDDARVADEVALRRTFIRALPLTALNDALRAVMLEGRGVAGIVRETATLGLWGLGTFALAIKLFRWR